MWKLEGYSRETDVQVDACLVPGLEEDLVRGILGRPEDEVIDGMYPVEGSVLGELAARAGYRPKPNLDYFLNELQD